MTEVLRGFTLEVEGGEEELRFLVREFWTAMDTLRRQAARERLDIETWLYQDCRRPAPYTFPYPANVRGTIHLRTDFDG